MANSTSLILAADVGGSHITSGMVNLDERLVITESIARNKVNRYGTADEILRVWSETLRMTINKSGKMFSGIAFAMPGPFDYEGGISLIRGFDKYEALYNIDIRRELSTLIEFPEEFILFRNDAEAFLAGEIFAGAAKGYSKIIGVTLGTGLGSAKSINGVTKDAERSTMLYNNIKIEEIVSTRGLLKIYEELTGIRLRDAKELSGLFATDENSQKSFSFFSGHLAWFLEQFILAERPELVVIGGNIANAWDLFMNDVVSKLEFAIETVPPIIKAELAEDAPLLGAACCFLSPVEITGK